MLLHRARDKEEATRDVPKSFLGNEDHKGKTTVVVPAVFWHGNAMDTWLSVHGVQSAFH